MLSSGVKRLICNPAVMQCCRAKVLSATCMSFHFERSCTEKLVILDGSRLRHSSYVVLFPDMPQDLTILWLQQIQIFLECTSLNSSLNWTLKHCGPGSVVDIATGYGLDGPGIESRWGRDFPHLSRLALGPNQPSVEWVPGLSWGVKSSRGGTLTPSTPSSVVVMKE